MCSGYFKGRAPATDPTEYVCIQSTLEHTTYHSNISAAVIVAAAQVRIHRVGSDGDTSGAVQEGRSGINQ